MTNDKNIVKIDDKDLQSLEKIMKRFVKILVNALAVVMLGVCCFSFTACEDIKKMEITTMVYSQDENKIIERTLSVDLYRHLAPKTVDSVIEAAKKGYYDNAFFYTTINHSSQIMIGDFKFVNGEVVQNNVQMPTIKGEFDRNGVVGSNLTSKRGSIGLWRSWYASGGYTTTNACNTGSASWYIPTANITGYTGYFAVFGQYDIEDENNAKLITDISVLSNDVDTFKEYVIYYTGEYQETGVNNGLTFHSVAAEDFDADAITDLFTAEGDQLVRYNAHTIKVPFVKDQIAARITKVTIK